MPTPLVFDVGTKTLGNRKVNTMIRMGMFLLEASTEVHSLCRVTWTQTLPKTLSS